jgi:hypothetical protein
MSKLFDQQDHGGQGHQRGGTAQYLGPRRTVKVAGKIIEERWTQPPPELDDDMFTEQLLAGVGSGDLRGPASGFGRYAATQQGEPLNTATSHDYRGVPTVRQDSPMLSEQYGSEINPEQDPSQSGVPPAIDFQREQSYDQHEEQESQVWENDDLGHSMRDATDRPEMEQSYVDRDDDLLDYEMQRYGSTHQERLTRLKGIFDDE